MSMKTKVAAVVTSLTVAGGGAALTTGTAQAATPSCGQSCIELYNTDIGSGYTLDVYKQAEKTGQPIILFRTSNSDPAEDFTISNEGSVADFYQAGLVTAALALRYGCIAGVTFDVCSAGDFNFEAYEIQYTPYGVESGLCVGVGVTAVSGTGVALEPCGASSKTIWVQDYPDGNRYDQSLPLINGSDTNFSEPLVLTYPGDGFPTDEPRPQLYTANLTGETTGYTPNLGTVDDNQLFTFEQGVLP
jgi:hypothetical protein